MSYSLNIPTITTERLILRAPAQRDLDTYCAYRMSERATLSSGVMTRSEAFNSFTGMTGHWVARGFGRWIIALNDTDPGIGHTGLLQLDASQPPEMTWTLWGDRHTGQGYATEAARAALAHITGPMGHTGIIAHIYPENTASIRMAERLGATCDNAAPSPDWMKGALTYRFGEAA